MGFIDVDQTVIVDIDIDIGPKALGGNIYHRRLDILIVQNVPYRPFLWNYICFPPPVCLPLINEYN